MIKKQFATPKASSTLVVAKQNRYSVVRAVHLEQIVERLTRAANPESETSETSDTSFVANRTLSITNLSFMVAIGKERSREKPAILI